jgi:hypothetical protein
MKLVRFSLILNLFNNTKNLKKFLILLNIGIFLSIFATSSSLISFYIEKKINDLEFQILNSQKDIKIYSKDISYMSDLKTKIILMVNNENDVNNLYEYIASQSNADALINVNDLYLPGLVIESELGSFDELKELFEDTETGIDVMRELFVQMYNEDSSEVREFDKIKKSLKLMINFDDKKYTKYYKKVFNFKIKDLLGEINDYTSINDFNDPIYIDYKKIDKMLIDLISVTTLIEQLFFDIKFLEEGRLQNLSNSLMKYSKNERNIIIFAFFFQIIMFLIIQIFEVTSLQKEMKNKKLRKK